MTTTAKDILTVETLIVALKRRSQTGGQLDAVVSVLRQLEEPAAIAVAAHAQASGISLAEANRRLGGFGHRVLRIAGIWSDTHPEPESAPAHRGERLQDYVA